MLGLGKKRIHCWQKSPWKEPMWNADTDIEHNIQIDTTKTWPLNTEIN